MSGDTMGPTAYQHSTCSRRILSLGGEIPDSATSSRLEILSGAAAAAHDVLPAGQSSGSTGSGYAAVGSTCVGSATVLSGHKICVEPHHQSRSHVLLIGALEEGMSLVGIDDELGLHAVTAQRIPVLV